jgi:hypothetical protein
MLFAAKKRNPPEPLQTTTQDRGQGQRPHPHRRHQRLNLKTKRDKLTASLLGLTIAMPFLWLKFSKSIIHPFPFSRQEIETQTFVYMAGGVLMWITFALFAVNIAQARWKKITKAFLYYCIYDAVIFFLFYSENNFYYLPLGAFLFIFWKFSK